MQAEQKSFQNSEYVASSISTPLIDDYASAIYVR